MIEKYLKDSIEGKERNDKVEQISKMNLLPPRLVNAIRTRDSMIHAKDPAYLLAKGYIKLVKDTIGLEDDDVENEDLEKLKKQKPVKNLPGNDTSVARKEAVLPNEKRKPLSGDSTKNN